MSEKVQVRNGVERDGKYYHNVIIKGEWFYNVPNIPKCKDCTSKKCRYYTNCIENNQGVVRTFDCSKNQDRVQLLWKVLTSAIAAILTLTYYETLSLGFFKGTAALIMSLVVLDIICCGIEWLVVVVRDNWFYRKLKKKQAKEDALKEQKRLAEEARLMKEQAEADAKDPNRIKIRDAESTLAQIAQISKDINFGECDEKVEFCVSKCKEIIEYLKKDSSGYIRVESLLQVYLPEFYRILAFYAEFEKAEAVEDEQRNRLNDTVNYFYDFLCKQKVEAIFDKKATEIKFNAAADALRREIEKRGGKL